jgi:hypothetical protein
MPGDLEPEALREAQIALGQPVLCGCMYLSLPEDSRGIADLLPTFDRFRQSTTGRRT